MDDREMKRKTKEYELREHLLEVGQTCWKLTKLYLTLATKLFIEFVSSFNSSRLSEEFTQVNFF